MKIPVLNGSPKRDKRGITKEAINAILLAICLLLSGCGGKSLSMVLRHPMRQGSGWNTAFWTKKNPPNWS